MQFTACGKYIKYDVLLNLLIIIIIITGSIARSAKLPVFNLLRGRF